MKIINTLYNEPPDEIEQIVKMTDTEYEQIKSDRALLEEAKGVLEKIYDKRFSVVAFLDYNEIKDFLARAKERLG